MAKEESLDTDTYWDVVDVIAENLELPKSATKNVVVLLEEGCTIPFIARYRKEKTGGMEVDKLRDVQSQLEDLKQVQNKVASVLKAIAKLGKLNRSLEKCIKNSKTNTEIEDLYAPFKPGHKGTLAERAKSLGLEPLASDYLNSPQHVDPKKYIDHSVKGLQSMSDIESGVKHIIADIVHKHKDSMDFIRGWRKFHGIRISSTECKQKETSKKDNKQTGKKEKAVKEPQSKKDSRHKYEQYFNFSVPANYIKPHQILAINRGEKNKYLSVKFELPDFVRTSYVKLGRKNFLTGSHNGVVAFKVVNSAIEDAFDRLAQPQMVRLIRSELTKKAEKESIEVFATNLKNLLLAPPVKGKCILGIDPGFKNGCKTAVITSTGQIVHTEIVYIHDYKSNKHDEKMKLMDMINQYNCQVFAIGNGVACRETETYISNLIKQEKLSMNYCIVDESGASIYSVSDEAKKELPSLDPSLRGAVSIARRLLDPLAELVKIEPKNIGVGQYQHDMQESQLKQSLDSVVEECVSFVGVDLNTGSESLLRRIAGLNVTRAKNILEWRDKNGQFINREQLRLVKGVGDKSFEQAAGFLRVHSNTTAKKEEPEEEEEMVGRKRKKQTSGGGKAKKKKGTVSLDPNILDTTWIHPESYHLADNLISIIGANKNHLGHEAFIQKVKQFMEGKTTSELSESLGEGEPTVNLIIKAFLKPSSFDFREESSAPLFRKEIQDIKSLKTGVILTGKITNVTHFGAFVDIGVGTNGLIHISKMKNSKLNLGDKVTVKVISIELQRNRIGLELDQTKV